MICVTPQRPEKNGETRHEQKILGLPKVWNLDVRSIQMVTDAKPSDETSERMNSLPRSHSSIIRFSPKVESTALS
jgi:hypothetical protein